MVNKVMQNPSAPSCVLSFGSLVLGSALWAGNATAAELYPLETRLGGKAYFDPNLGIT